MTLPRTVADVLSDHVMFEVESIDRMYLNVWVPRLSHGGGVAGFFVGHRGHVYASTALMDPMTKTFVADIHHFIAAHDLELLHFGKGERKDDITQRLLAGFTAEEGVLYVGRGPGEGRRVAHPAPPQPGHREQLVRQAALAEHALVRGHLRRRRVADRVGVPDLLSDRWPRRAPGHQCVAAFCGKHSYYRPVRRSPSHGHPRTLGRSAQARPLQSWLVSRFLLVMGTR